MTKDEVLAQIKSLVSDEHYANIISVAATENDEGAYLARVLQLMLNAQDNDNDYGLPEGFTIVDYVEPVYPEDDEDRNRQPSKSVDNEMCYVRKEVAIEGDEPVVEYCGAMGKWAAQPHFMTPWANPVDASKYIVDIYIPQFAKNKPARAFRVNTFAMPMILVDKPERGRKVNLELDREQTQKLIGYQEALRQSNALLADGSPVKSGADVVRFLLEK